MLQLVRSFFRPAIVGVMVDRIRGEIIAYLDKGLPQHVLIRCLTGQHWVSDPRIIFTREEAKEAIEEMVADGTLARGRAHGSRKFLVVRDFMPQTAEFLDIRHGRKKRKDAVLTKGWSWEMYQDYFGR